ncbi:hypothetical protein HK097_000063 [Rhizophlyctis rosea]|uniref:Phosphatidic acid phosphatase type 2/haloperoxidase domain-containing protein n=1 Tax=Rhizophlyctis rosea TaxID=64517 RepID=A0AAD5SRN4_9FUNG|nr:hypothetical protein HK097_000063 [Rhizophlyctis rosea]
MSVPMHNLGAYQWATIQGSTFAAAQIARHRWLGDRVEQAAISFTAHGMLLYFFPNEQRMFDLQLSNWLAELKKDGATAREIENAKNIAKDVVTKMLGRYAQSGVNTYVPFNGTWTPNGAAPPPGEYIPTPPRNLWPPAAPQARYASFYVLNRPTAAYRSRAPPAIDSPEYAAFLDEIKAYGAAQGSIRTSEQSQIAQFHVEMPPPRFNRILSTILQTQSPAPSALDTAYYFALLNFAIADANTVTWDAKVHYNTWRPVTAIQHPSTWLHNKTRITDPTWMPLLNTPDHAEYLSGHSTLSGAATEVLKEIFKRDDVQFSVTYNATGYGSLTRRYNRFSEHAEEVAISRLYGGVHFRFANEVGSETGKRIGTEVVDGFKKNGWAKAFTGVL